MSWFSPQIIGAGLVSSEELGTSSWSPTWVADAQALAPCSVAFPGTLVGVLKQPPGKPSELAIFPLL